MLVKPRLLTSAVIIASAYRKSTFEKKNIFLQSASFQVTLKSGFNRTLIGC